jgi:hypothetical protein
MNHVTATRKNGSTRQVHADQTQAANFVRIRSSAARSASVTSVPSGFSVRAMPSKKYSAARGSRAAGQRHREVEQVLVHRHT